MSKYLATVFLLVCAGFGQLHQKVDQPSTGPIRRLELHPSKFQQLTMPALSYWDYPRCDLEGNAYVHAAANVNDATVAKLQFLKDEATLYSWKKSDRWTGFESFGVSPTGRVWVLGRNDTADLFVVGFDSSGKEATRSKLDVPTTVEVQQFAATPEDRFFIAGYFDENAPEPKQGLKFAALYDKSGALVKTLDGDASAVDLKKVRREPPQGSVTVGPDGNFYFLQSKHVLVLTQSGELVRKISTDPPDPSATPAHIWISSDYKIAVVFEVKDKQHPERLIPYFLVSNALTGVPEAYYYLPQDFRGTPVCFDGKYFTLTGNESGRVVVMRAAIQ